MIFNSGVGYWTDSLLPTHHPSLLFSDIVTWVWVLDIIFLFTFCSLLYFLVDFFNLIFRTLKTGFKFQSCNFEDPSPHVINSNLTVCGCIIFSSCLQLLKFAFSKMLYCCLGLCLSCWGFSWNVWFLTHTQRVKHFKSELDVVYLWGWWILLGDLAMSFYWGTL